MKCDVQSVAVLSTTRPKCCISAAELFSMFGFASRIQTVCEMMFLLNETVIFFKNQPKVDMYVSISLSLLTLYTSRYSVAGLRDLQHTDGTVAHFHSAISTSNVANLESNQVMYLSRNTV